MIVTDHSCLRYQHNMKDVGGQLTRWSLCLPTFSHTITHRPGADNGNADSLSYQACIANGPDNHPDLLQEGNCVGDPQPMENPEQQAN